MIDKLGGMIPAIEQGYPQREVQDASYRAQLAIEHQSQIIVGVNDFTSEETIAPDVLKIDPALEKAQVERLHAWRNKRPEGVLERHQNILYSSG